METKTTRLRIARTTVYLEPLLSDKVAQIADRQGMSVSDYLRKLILHDLTSKSALSPEDVMALAGIG